jgi:hypothetical protein
MKSTRRLVRVETTQRRGSHRLSGGPCSQQPLTKPDDHPESFPGSHLGLTITSMLQGHFVYWKGLEPSELLEYDSYFVAFMQERPFQEGKPLSPKGERAAQSYSSIAIRLTTCWIIKSTWLPFVMRMTMNRVPSTTKNYLRTCLPMSVWRTPPRMRTRSTKGSGG